MTVPGGATTALFDIITDSKHPKSTDITASFAGISRTATLTVTKPVASLSFWSRTIARLLDRHDPISLLVRTEPLATSNQSRRYSLYTPEMNLLAETESSSASTPAIAYEYVWFGGQPVAQFETVSNRAHYYYNDHLGTPILTTDATAAVNWRVERDPFGSRYSVRTGSSRYQPLAFPGQEEDASTDRSYNIFRWYRSGWRRYTQADPIGIPGKEFPYASGNPILNTDVLGLRDTSDLLRRPITRLVCETAGEGAGWVAGRALGLITLLMSSGGDLNPAEFEANRNCDKCRKGPKCRPCIPPVGTLAFREDTNPASAPHRGVPPPHWHLYEMHQSPPQAGCVCFWHPITDNRGGFGASPPPPGTVPITPAAGGGLW